MAERRPVEFEVVSQIFDQWLGVNAYPRRGGGLAVYITARRPAAPLIRESEERLRLAVEATGMGTWDIDIRSGPFDWSARYRDMLGIPDSVPACQAGFDAILHPLDREAVGAEQARVLQPASGGRYQIEYRTRIPRADGTERWIRSVGQVHFDEAGRAIRVVGTSLDVSDLKQGQATLARAKAELQRRGAPRTSELAAPNRALLTQIDERERVEAHLRQSQRIEAVGQLTPGVAP